MNEDRDERTIERLRDTGFTDGSYKVSITTSVTCDDKAAAQDAMKRYPSLQEWSRDRKPQEPTG